MIAAGRSSDLAPSQIHWGDGFAEDDWSSQICSVRAWSGVNEDELFRFLPNLVVRADERLPEPIRSAFRRFLSTSADTALTDQKTDQRSLHVSKGPSIRLQAGKLVTALASLQTAAAVPEYDDYAASLMAFFAGVHPAFLWPEALLAHDRFATVAWLGHLQRCRRAVMPAEVAQYLVDIIAPRVDGHVLLEDRLRDFLPVDASVRDLRLSADRRTRGASIVFNKEHSWWLRMRPWR